ncbi:helix-turn-helix domain-containing protein [Paenibacillus sp. strain BS8-2]
MQNAIAFPNITTTLQVTGFQLAKFPPGWTYPRHHHHLYELLCCLGGEADQEINRTTVTLRPGDWLLINAGERHRTSNASDMEYDFFNVHFDLDDLDLRSLLGTAAYRFVSAEEANRSGRLSRYIGELQELTRKSQADESNKTEAKLEDKLLLQGNIFLIIRELLSLIREQSEDSAGTGKVTPFAANLAHAIEEKLSLGLFEEISITTIAKELNMSRSQCSKLFTKVYGLSPRQYISKQKLMLAKELLVTSYLSVTDIAERLGFQSASHFSRQFRRWTGLSPTEFKPKHRRNPLDG